MLQPGTKKRYLLSSIGTFRRSLFGKMLHRKMSYGDVLTQIGGFGMFRWHNDDDVVFYARGSHLQVKMINIFVLQAFKK